MTAQQLINLALADIGIIDAGGSPSTAESNDALSTLNHIIDGWSVEELMVPTRAHATFSLTINVGSYTLGPGGTWSTANRVMRLTGAKAYVGNFERGLEVLPIETFKARITNGSGITSALPELIGADSSSPVNVRIWPAPNTASFIEVDYWSPLTAVASLATTITMTPGCELALRHALAMAMAPGFGREMPASYAAQAQASKAAVMALTAAINQPPAPAPAQ